MALGSVGPGLRGENRRWRTGQLRHVFPKMSPSLCPDPPSSALPETRTRLPYPMCSEGLHQVPVGRSVAIRSPGGRVQVAQLPQKASQSARRGPQSRHSPVLGEPGPSRSRARWYGRSCALHSAVYRPPASERHARGAQGREPQR